MSDLNDRRRAFEAQFAQNQDQLFQIESRAIKLLGLWAAERMEFSEQEAQNYALSLVSHNQTEPGLEDVLTKVIEDLTACGHDTSDLAQVVTKTLQQAKAQLTN